MSFLSVFGLFQNFTYQLAAPFFHIFDHIVSVCYLLNTTFVLEESLKIEEAELNISKF